MSAEHKLRTLLAWATYTIIILLGIVAIVSANSKEGFWRDTLLNIGSDLVVVTIVFIVFQLFGRRDEAQRNSAEHSPTRVVPKELADEIEHVPSDLRGVLTSRSSTSGIGSPTRDYDGVEDED